MGSPDDAQHRLGLPQDPYILLSWVNTKLRDEYDSLAALCEDHQADPADLSARLEAAGFRYDPERNQFR